VSGSWSRDELNGSVGARFRRIAARVPALDAVSGTDGCLTFGELDRQSLDLARRIAAAAASRAGQVAALCGRDTSRIVAFVGAALSGRALVMLDWRSPAAWNAGLLANSDALVLLYDEGAADAARTLAAASSWDIVRVQVDSGDSGSPSAELPEIHGRDLAAIVYTSGSTGAPKGVMRPHDSLLRDAWVHGEVGGVGAGDRFGSIAAAAYARASGDAVAALLNGACLCPYDFARYGATGLGDWLVAERITSLNLPIAVAREWNASKPPAVSVPALRDIRFSGAAVHWRDIEELTATLVGRWHPWTQYSSSEAGSITRSDAFDVRTLTDGPLHVGTAVCDRTITLLDTDGRDVAPGESGEVVVRGRFLSTGYWNDPALTHACFETLDAETTLLRTGDMARLDPDGNLHLMGRRDDVVKVRGVSVEPADIESILQAWPLLSHALVLPSRDVDGEPALAAYVVPAAAGSVTEAEVRSHVARVRPAFAVPRRVLVLDRIPALDNGKPDREALRRLTDTAAPTHVARGSATVDTVRRAWCDVLGCDSPGLEDTFMALGGDSFAVARLERRLAELLDRPLELIGLLAHPTISAQARWIDDLIAGRTGNTPSPAAIACLAERPGGDRIYMLPAIDGTLSYAMQFAASATRLSVYGVEPPLRGEGSFDANAFDDLAAPMAVSIAAHAQGRRVSLMGPCGGGKLGLEIAARLQALGTAIDTVVVVEAPGVTDKPPWGAACAQDVAAWVGHAVRTLVAETASAGPLRPLRYLAATLRIVSRTITRPRPGRGTIRERRRATQFRVMSRSHERATYRFPVLLIRGAWSQLGLQFAGSGASLGWDRHCPILSIRFAPGTHASVYQAPFVEALTRIVEDCTGMSERTTVH
jgi:acyl-coenzyme A synthetase/AMP-(fatty) acid ligase/thioesterase domain-containing protein